MQDNYVGDIGDYGKYGLLRTICSEEISLSVNWYRVNPKTFGKQDDGKYIQYLSSPQTYRNYDPLLFDVLHKIVCVAKDRHIESIEKANLFPAHYFSDVIGKNRNTWHQAALSQTQNANTVFLDPDNGLETKNMFLKNQTTEKHVKWTELKDYYKRGQNVILYQHRPQMTKKSTCIDAIMEFQKTYLNADCVLLLEFPKYTNRFYFIFAHEKYRKSFASICKRMTAQWGENNFCKQIIIP